MKPATSLKAFLSYARMDGEVFATALRRRLAEQEPEITLWQDRAQLEGGVGWWVQIEEALDRVTVLIIVMTPYALRSENTAREWRYARQRGVIVYPVKGVPDHHLDYAALPRWMRKVHFYDLGHPVDGEWRDAKEWETFVTHLKRDVQPVRVPFMAPDLPAGFISRTREFEELLRLLLDSRGEQPVAMTTALQGAGGYGKTTLAIALCHDERVIEAFDDGVLWTSLGQTPRVEEKLASLYGALTRESLTFIDAADGATALSDKLKSRNCLLVIDDVWHRKHLEPFLKGGHQCVRLMTTRKFDLAVGTRRVLVDEMTAAESIELLATAFPASTVSRARLADLVRRLGEWPLLMNLAAGVVRLRLEHGDSPEGALAYVERLLDKYGITAFDPDDLEKRDEFVRNTVAASRAQLSAPDSARFGDLGVFPEEVAIPLVTMARLWNLDDVDTQSCAQRLAAVSLLQLDLQRGVVRLHDVMREYLLRDLYDAALVHARLVDAYGDLERPADDYAWRWLPYHLKQADRQPALRSLLLEPPWLYGKLQAAGAHALIADFDLLSGDRDLDFIASALRLALPALIHDPRQLWEQLLGRLPSGCSDVLDTMLRNLTRTAPWPRLRARWPNLQRAGGELVQTLTGHNARIGGAFELTQGRVLSWGADGMRLWDLANQGQTLLHDNQSISGARLLRDGRVLWWSGTALRLWDPATRESRELSDHGEDVKGACLIQDRIAASWSGHTARVWRLDVGEQLCSMSHQSDVAGAVPMRNGDVLTWEVDGTLHVWDPAASNSDGRRVHTDGVSGVLVLPNENTLSWGKDGRVLEWDFATGDSRLLRDGCYGLEGALLLPDRCVLAWGHGDPSLSVWDLETGESQELMTGGPGIAGVQLARDGRLLSWGYDSKLRVWDLGSGENRTLTGHTGPVEGAVMLEDRRVLSWGDDQTLRVWDMSGTGSAPAGHERAVQGILALSHSRALSWGDGRLIAWDLTTGRSRPLQGHGGFVNAHSLADGRVLSVGDELCVWTTDLTSGTGRRLDDDAFIVQAHVLPDERILLLGLSAWICDSPMDEARILTDALVSDVLLLPDGRVLMLGGHPWIWDPATDSRRMLDGQRADKAVLLPDGRALSWNGDGTLQLWDLAFGEARLLTASDYTIGGVLLLPNRHALTWGTAFSIGGPVRTWDLETGRWDSLEGHGMSASGALLLHDGRVLSWGWERTMRITNLATKESYALTGHDRQVLGAVQLADGRVISWSDDRTLRLWNVESPDPALTFYFDAAPSVVLPDASLGVVVGDSLGGIHVIEIPDPP